MASMNGLIEMLFDLSENCNFDSSHPARSWSAKLYLTPSNIVLLTAIALVGVCACILAVIGALHWQEKVCSRGAAAGAGGGGGGSCGVF